MKRMKFTFACLVLASVLTAGLFAGCGEQHTHTLTRVPAQQSYCKREGNIEYWKCDECGKYFADEAAQEEISLEETVLPYQHKLQYVEAVAADGVFSYGSIAHYKCSACGALFADKDGTQPIEEAEVYEQKKFDLTEARIYSTPTNQTVRVFAKDGETKRDLAVTADNFVLRVFLGWEGADPSELTQSIGGRVNLNIDTEANIASGKWMSFRLGYDSRGGYFHFSDQNVTYFDKIEDGGKLMLAIREQSGLYVTLVHIGGIMMAYAEDLQGNAIYLGSTQGFGASALVKCTLGVHQSYYATEQHPAVLKEGVLLLGATDPAALAPAKD